MFSGEHVRTFSREAQEVAVRTLLVLDAAMSLDDMRVLPANRLEMFGGGHEGQRCALMNRHWRILFTWRDGNAADVGIAEYHWGAGE